MRILFLSCSTGEGHNSAARSLMDAFSALDVESDIIDLIMFKKDKKNRVASSRYQYNFIISHFPHLFGFIYKIGGIYEATHLPSPVAYFKSKYAGELCEYIKKGGFDAVVATHIYPMQAMVAVRKKYGLDIPTFCILTDYTVIPFYKDANSLDAQFISCEHQIKMLVKRGFDKDKIYNLGIPTNPKFGIDITKEEAKAQLGLPIDKRMVMLLSGGAGCGKISKICEKLNERLSADTVICVFPGKNAKLSSALKSKFADNARVFVVDFTPDVNIYMKAADVVLSKPGGLSSTEIAASRVPLVHLKEIPGCESANIKHFTKTGMSVPGRTVKSAVEQTLRLLSDVELAENMRKCQRENISSDSAKHIAEKILDEIRK